jgi:hypothetical protein
MSRLKQEFLRPSMENIWGNGKNNDKNVWIRTGKNL